MAVTFVAPFVFKTYFEWEIALILGCLLAIGLILRTIVDFMFDETVAGRWRMVFAPLALLFLAPSAVEVMDLVKFLQPADEDVVYAVRNFFGALTIRERDEDDPEQRIRHACVMGRSHTARSTPTRRSGSRRSRTTVRRAGIARAVNWYRDADKPGGMRLGVIGLGTGTMAAFAGNGDYVAFYEINPAVIEISESGRWFTYLPDAKARGAEYEIKLGDARLSMERELRENRVQKYHVILMDAFSGDAIPAHLLTEEMFETYLKHLSTNEGGDQIGSLVVHISNRYVDLEPIVRGAAERFGLRTAMIENSAVNSENIFSSTYIVMSKNDKLMDDLAAHAATPDTGDIPAILWTDKRSNLFEVMRDWRDFKHSLRDWWRGEPMEPDAAAEEK